jgi:hypothetical protein
VVIKMAGKKSSCDCGCIPRKQKSVKAAKSKKKGKKSQ